MTHSLAKTIKLYWTANSWRPELVCLDPHFILYTGWSVNTVRPMFMDFERLLPCTRPCMNMTECCAPGYIHPWEHTHSLISAGFSRASQARPSRGPPAALYPRHVARQNRVRYDRPIVGIKSFSCCLPIIFDRCVKTHKTFTYRASTLCPGAISTIRLGKQHTICRFSVQHHA